MDQVTLLAVLAGSGVPAAAGAKGVLVLVLRTMVRFSVAVSATTGAPSGA